jgi:hypothetical protein
LFITFISWIFSFHIIFTERRSLSFLRCRFRHISLFRRFRPISSQLSLISDISPFIFHYFILHYH